MNFELSPELEAFRQEVASWIRQELHPEKLTDAIDWEVQGGYKEWFLRSFFRNLAAKGWVGLSWPGKDGGKSGSRLEQSILNNELLYHRAPNLLLTTDMTAPALALFCNEAQKEKFLAPIARGEILLCVGYTEPNAGSDLAAVETRAVCQGDEWAITGQKIFTSYARMADYIWLLVRTDPAVPKHQGLSLFLVDMKLPGITIQDIRTATGWWHFSVFFDEVRVPRSAVVGEMNRGWYQIMTALDYERGSAAAPGRAQRCLDDLVEYCRTTRRSGRRLSADPLIRHHLADLVVDAETARLLYYRVAWMQTVGQLPNVEASVAKVVTSEFTRRVAGVGMQILGHEGLLTSKTPSAPLEGLLPWEYMQSIPNIVAAGSNEIQRNIIATRGLGLPRE